MKTNTYWVSTYLIQNNSHYAINTAQMYTATVSYNLLNETVYEMSDYDLEKKSRWFHILKYNIL